MSQLFTELTLSEQETLSGGSDNRNRNRTRQSNRVKNANVRVGKDSEIGGSVEGAYIEQKNDNDNDQDIDD